ncbi:hypothetical protein M404DRAFT_998606 [Pisolithus tinctorius Marx 270]|uniref:Uncharacterized protein n=1 Tax=Pisolithus tinctorius Marx 270 TaxID=870435 RepID=A0A0C3P2E5_PISTI|nr:hypothetical protein M404DRAFT_998606 [Pisolithus tinctorius Marx 270]
MCHPKWAMANRNVHRLTSQSASLTLSMKARSANTFASVPTITLRGLHVFKFPALLLNACLRPKFRHLASFGAFTFHPSSTLVATPDHYCIYSNNGGSEPHRKQVTLRSAAIR